MLYQKRPFGHDMSQQRILQEGIITNARTVSFPDRPTVSSETKVSARCLPPLFLQQRFLQQSSTRTGSFVVRDGAQEFIMLCLTHAQRLRPDVKELAEHTYLKATKR